METSTPDDLPFIDEHRHPLGVPLEVAWSTMVRWIARRARSTGYFPRLLGCEPLLASPSFAGLPGDTVPGFRVVDVEPGRRLVLRGRHRFARYSLTLELVDAELRARTHAVFPGLHGKLYRALVIGSGAHRLITRKILRQVARTAQAGTIVHQRSA